MTHVGKTTTKDAAFRESFTDLVDSLPVGSYSLDLTTEHTQSIKHHYGLTIDMANIPNNNLEIPFEKTLQDAFHDHYNMHQLENDDGIPISYTLLKYVKMDYDTLQLTGTIIIQYHKNHRPYPMRKLSPTETKLRNIITHLEAKNVDLRMLYKEEQDRRISLETKLKSAQNIITHLEDVIKNEDLRITEELDRRISLERKLKSAQNIITHLENLIKNKDRQITEKQDRQISLERKLKSAQNKRKTITESLRKKIRVLYDRNIEFYEDCPVCYEKITSAELAINNCMHLICKTCSSKCTQCPECREPY